MMVRKNIDVKTLVASGLYHHDIPVREVATYLTKKLGRIISPQLVRYWRRKEDEIPRVKNPIVIYSLDIETAPTRAYAWGAWQQNLGTDQILTDWYILAFAAKRLGGKVEYMDKSESWQDEDDNKLLQRLWEILDEADIIVAQNGRRFDAKKIRTRLLLEGFPPPSPFKIVDTLEVLKHNFAFNKNSLEFVSPRVCRTPKRSHGKYPGFKLWEACLRGVKSAWSEMRLYNIDDVESLEQLYIALRPWDTKHPNVAIYMDDDKQRCGRCGSEHLTIAAKAFRTNAGVYDLFVCNSCGGWCSGKTLRNSLTKRRLLTGSR